MADDYATTNYLGQVVACSGGVGSTQAGLQHCTQAGLQHYGQIYGGQAYAEPPPVKRLEVEAIIPGEIIAWRLWRLKEGRLHSYYMDHIAWPHGEPLQVDERVGDYSGSGIHAYKTLKNLKHRYCFAFGMASIDQVVYGKVALWGEVVEHEEGYRAEFAKPLSLSWTCPRWLFAHLRLRDVRKAYGL